MAANASWRPRSGQIGAGAKDRQRLHLDPSRDRQGARSGRPDIGTRLLARGSVQLLSVPVGIGLLHLSEPRP